MKKGLTLALILLTTNISGENNLTDEAKSIVAEGKLLYKSEMASWYGTDLFLENYKNRENIGGYFSYLDNDVAKCVFFSNAQTPNVIGTISFDSTYNVKTAKVDLEERNFTKKEHDLYEIRKTALDELKTNSDYFFKFYQNTNPNIIPLINEQEKKAYVLTGSKNHGIVIFGNDYLLTFDENNTLIEKKQLHNNIIPIEYGAKDVKATMHSHSPSSGDFITATDICTLMLYGKLAQWEKHYVFSGKYLNIWNCETDELTVILKEDAKKYLAQ